MAPTSEPATRVSENDWLRVSDELDAQGCARLVKLLSQSECDSLRALYDQEQLFRSRIELAKHGYGRGEYKYFDYPLPPLVRELRADLYAPLVALANRWNRAMGIEVSYPSEHREFVERCHAAGQLRPTPLLLAYGEGDYNCLHQDLYGEHVFPLQVAVLLAQPGRDFSGGELVLTEQRPRMQSRPMVLSLEQGDALVFAVNQRPVPGKRGSYRVKVRHGVSRIHSGRRHTLGIIFHDAT